MMPRDPTKPMTRCAIYTRKSTEEGLEQDFNSLDAQREAGEAYIASQRHEGWVLIKDRYDDGGISGATLERPGLQRLLDDCRSGKIDCVVVYKVDRLSRSLFDFAQLIETFTAADVTFVSVTQHFNTNDSMGRLTLNILLSFAQFEREVIAERIRDKMAASRKKGKWVGGRPPFGYDVDYQKKLLLINDEEARWVRWIFDRFLQTRSTTVVIEELKANGVATKTWTTKNGSHIKGTPWSRSGIYKLLSNRTYLGEVEYKGAVYNGEHDAIVDRSVWDEVHALLAEAPQARANRDRVISTRAARNPAFLIGLVRCAHCGSSMSPSATTGKNGALYRYYRCQTAQKHGADQCPVGSVPAGDLEREVLKRVKGVFQAPEVLAAASRAARKRGDQDGVAVDHQAVTDALRKIDTVWNELYPGEQTRIATVLLDHISVGLNRVAMTVRSQGLEHLMDLGDELELTAEGVEVELPVVCRRRSGRTRLLGPANGSETQGDEPNLALEALARGFVWQEALERGDAPSVRALAMAEGVDEAFVRRLLDLVGQPPRIVTSLINGGSLHCAADIKSMSKQGASYTWAD